MDKLLLKGKVAVISGATGGIGTAITQLFAREGASILGLFNQDEHKVMSLTSEFRASNTNFHFLKGDLTKDDDIKNVFAKTMTYYGRCDILINCAGIISRKHFEDCEYKDWSNVIDLNLNAPYKLCRLFLPLMRKQNYGKVVNITSQMAFKVHEGASPSYEVSKAALTALTRHLATRYAKYNITINSLAPGSFSTKLADTMPNDIKTNLLNCIPTHRLGNVQEAANAALFLASEQSTYVNGTTLHVNGGSYCN